MYKEMTDVKLLLLHRITWNQYNKCIAAGEDDFERD